MYGLKWVVLVNGVGRDRFYINAGWSGLEWVEIDTVQSSVARTTRGPHNKSRILELKSHIHTVKFY